MTHLHHSLRSFLINAKDQLLAALKYQQRLTIVVGNESAGPFLESQNSWLWIDFGIDLDSLSSSVLYAYLRSLDPPETSFTPTYVPLLNIQASDIRLRPEFAALLKHANVSTSQLITLDDLPGLNEIEKTLKPANTRWILVDHNKLQGFLGTVYKDRVRGVIDHHDEENAVCQDTDPEPRVVEKCGSCTSLVVRTLKTTWDSTDDSQKNNGSSIDGNEAHHAEDAQVAKLALASILIDTANLTAEGKVEQADIEAVQYLEDKIQKSPQDLKTWDKTQFYNEINTAKKTTDSLTLTDLLRKDYKQWTENNLTLGISSILQPLSSLPAKALSSSPPHPHPHPLTKTITSFVYSKSLSIFAIMTISTSPCGTPTRELFLQASSSFTTRFARKAVSELGLEKLSVEGLVQGTSVDDEGVQRSAWTQREVAKSRKQVAPLMREAMR